MENLNCNSEFELVFHLFAFKCRWKSDVSHLFSLPLCSHLICLIHTTVQHFPIAHFSFIRLEKQSLISILRVGQSKWIEFNGNTCNFNLFLSMYGFYYLHFLFVFVFEFYWGRFVGVLVFDSISSVSSCCQVFFPFSLSQVCINTIVFIFICLYGFALLVVVCVCKYNH